MPKKEKTKRHLRFNGADIPDIEISKVSVIKKGKNMFYLDQLDDGTYRLVYSLDMIPDLTKVNNIEIIRED